MKELKISAIREGTVVDHIPTKNVFKVAEILDVKSNKNVVSVATNLPSKKMGHKGIIKVGGRTLTKDELNKIALLAPDATVSDIKNFNVKNKFNINIPQKAENIIICNNPKCITNMEDVITKFEIIDTNPLTVKCNYCERSMVDDEIKIK